MFKKTIATLLVAAMAFGTVEGLNYGKDNLFYAESIDLPDSTIGSIPSLSSEYNFIRYIDNSDTGEYKPIISEVFTKDWEQFGGVHKYKAKEDGTIMFYTLSSTANIRGIFYGDFALTNKLADSCENSNRKEAAQFEVKKGKTYYFRQERWNGTGELKGTTYMGFIPKSASSAKLNVNVKYNEAGNDVVKEFSSYNEFLNNYESGACSDLYVRTEWTGLSEVKSFTVKKSGWLLAYALHKNNNIDLHIYTDKELSNKIANFRTDVNKEITDPQRIWLDAGTYYYQGERWNGFEEDDLNSPMKTYFGFVPTEKFITASNAVLSADKKSATVTFTTKTAGKIRVQDGAFAPYKIDDSFWDVENRTNMLPGKSFVAKANKYYTARFEDNKSGLSFMITFSVNGIIDKQAVPGKAKIKSAKNVKGKKIKIKLKRVKNATGYIIKYATNKKFKKAKTKKVKKLTITLKKLKKKKKYFIKVCAFNKSGKGKWSKVKKVKVKK